MANKPQMIPVHKRDILAITAIIDACKNSGVSKLKFGGLELEFHSGFLSEAAVGTPKIASTLPRPDQLDLVDRDIAALAEEERIMLEDPQLHEDMQIDRLRS